MTKCTQAGCTGTIVDGYCDVCGSPGPAETPAKAPAATPSTADPGASVPAVPRPSARAARVVIISHSVTDGTSGAMR